MEKKLASRAFRYTGNLIVFYSNLQDHFFYHCNLPVTGELFNINTKLKINKSWEVIHTLSGQSLIPNLSSYTCLPFSLQLTLTGKEQVPALTAASSVCHWWGLEASVTWWWSFFLLKLSRKLRRNLSILRPRDPLGPSTCGIKNSRLNSSFIINFYPCHYATGVLASWKDKVIYVWQIKKLELRG